MYSNAFRVECAETEVTFNICASSIGHFANAMKRHIKKLFYCGVSSI